MSYCYLLLIRNSFSSKIDIGYLLLIIMKKPIKADVAPGEFKCRTCDVTWLSFRESNSPCTDTTQIRNGLHDFDFSNPV